MCKGSSPFLGYIIWNYIYGHLGLFFLSNNDQKVFSALIYHTKNLDGNNKLKLVVDFNVVLFLVAFKHPIALP